MIIDAIDPEFLVDTIREEAQVQRHNEYVKLCEHAGQVPLGYKEWIEFDKKYQEHVRTAPSVLSPPAFQRITESQSKEPTIGELHHRIDRLLVENEQLQSERDFFDKERQKLAGELDKLKVVQHIPENYSKFPHYFREVPRHVKYIDINWILERWGVSHTVGHAVKKLLCAGQRGYKEKLQDFEEAKNSIVRAIEIERE